MAYSFLVEEPSAVPGFFDHGRETCGEATGESDGG
jgi:hypothetical protein